MAPLQSTLRCAASWGSAPRRPSSSAAALNPFGWTRMCMQLRAPVAHRVPAAAATQWQLKEQHPRRAWLRSRASEHPCQHSSGGRHRQHNARPAARLRLLAVHAAVRQQQEPAGVAALLPPLGAAPGACCSCGALKSGHSPGGCWQPLQCGREQQQAGKALARRVRPGDRTVSECSGCRQCGGDLLLLRMFWVPCMKGSRHCVQHNWRNNILSQVICWHYCLGAVQCAPLCRKQGSAAGRAAFGWGGVMLARSPVPDIATLQ